MIRRVDRGDYWRASRLERPEAGAGRTRPMGEDRHGEGRPRRVIRSWRPRLTGRRNGAGSIVTAPPTPPDSGPPWTDLCPVWARQECRVQHPGLPISPVYAGTHWPAIQGRNAGARATRTVHSRPQSGASWRLVAGSRGLPGPPVRVVSIVPGSARSGLTAPGLARTCGSHCFCGTWSAIGAPCAVLDPVRGRPASPRGAKKWEKRGDPSHHGRMLRTCDGARLRATSPII
jgi:hypothetical protein